MQSDKQLGFPCKHGCSVSKAEVVSVCPVNHSGGGGKKKKNRNACGTMQHSFDIFIHRPGFFFVYLQSSLFLWLGLLSLSHAARDRTKASPCQFGKGERQNKDLSLCSLNGQKPFHHLKLAVFSSFN